MNDLLLAFMILTGTLGVVFLIGGAMLFRDSEKDQRSAARFMDLTFFGAVVFTVYDIANHWGENLEGRVCIIVGSASLLLAITLGIFRSLAT